MNVKKKKERKKKHNWLQAKNLKRRGEHSAVLYFVNNICKSYLPNTSKRKFMIELLHDLILYKNKKAQLTLSNPRDAKACKNWSHSSLKQVTV